MGAASVYEPAYAGTPHRRMASTAVSALAAGFPIARE